MARYSIIKHITIKTWNWWLFQKCFTSNEKCSAYSPPHITRSNKKYNAITWKRRKNNNNIVFSSGRSRVIFVFRFMVRDFFFTQLTQNSFYTCSQLKKLTLFVESWTTRITRLHIMLLKITSDSVNLSQKKNKLQPKCNRPYRSEFWGKPAIWRDDFVNHHLYT